MTSAETPAPATPTTPAEWDAYWADRQRAIYAAADAARTAKAAS